jgi:hypothetical protein
VDEIEQLRARVAEVEAKLVEQDAQMLWSIQQRDAHRDRAEAAEARLAAVLAECDLTRRAGRGRGNACLASGTAPQDP